MKKRVPLLILFFLITAITWWIWGNYRYLLGKQSHKDNKGYPVEIKSITSLRKKLKKEKAPVKILEQQFIQVMTERIFPYWYGTKWAFYGTTEIPNEGNIACGYFVTTTLRDAGVTLERITLAKCASEEMIRTLTDKKYIYHFSGINLSDFETGLKKRGNGLYLVGLDNHTGFLLLTEKENYFIHSSGAYPFQVVKDVLSDSKILAKSKYRVVGKISADEKFLKRWVTAER